MTSGNGFSINDVLETDYKTLFDIFGMDDSAGDSEDEVIPIDEFMRLHPEL